ncbi:MAG: hypothetical protein KGN02_15220 [bacterium]|nr:hypothetical protein [bacterium]
MLAGCGGGAGSTTPPLAGSGNPATSVSAATPTPSPSSQTGSAAYTYAGTLTQTFQSFPEVAAPGTPSPEPTSVTTIDVTQQISVKDDQAFNGGSGLTDYHDVETDAQSSGLKTTTSTTDTYETVAQSGSAQNLLDYGSVYADEAGDTMTTSYAPARIEDELPESGGASWSNGAGATIEEAIAGDASGSPVTVQRVVANAGTYSESTTYPPGYQAIGYTGVGDIQENADGSGSYAWVAVGSPLTIEYSQPVPQPTGAPQITIAEFTNLDPTPAEAPSQSFSFASWYGFSPSFYGETDKDLGSVAVPASCNLGSQLPQTANAIQQTTNRVDTIVGYTEQEVQTTYVVAGESPVCTTLHDVQQIYYDFNGDQAFVFSALTPLQITTIDETLAMQNSTTVASRAKQAATARAGGMPSLAPALRAHFDRAVENARRRQVQVIARMLALHQRGVQK